MILNAIWSNIIINLRNNLIVNQKCYVPTIYSTYSICFIGYSIVDYAIVDYDIVDYDIVYYDIVDYAIDD